MRRMPPGFIIADFAKNAICTRVSDGKKCGPKASYAKRRFWGPLCNLLLQKRKKYGTVDEEDSLGTGFAGYDHTERYNYGREKSDRTNRGLLSACGDGGPLPRADRKAGQNDYRPHSPEAGAEEDRTHRPGILGAGPDDLRRRGRDRPEIRRHPHPQDPAGDGKAHRHPRKRA